MCTREDVIGEETCRKGIGQGVLMQAQGAQTGRSVQFCLVVWALQAGPG